MLPDLRLLAGNWEVIEELVVLAPSPDWTQVADADSERWAIGFSPGQNASILISTNVIETAGITGFGIAINSPGFRHFYYKDWGQLVQLPWFVIDTGGGGRCTVFRSSIRPKSNR